MTHPLTNNDFEGNTPPVFKKKIKSSQQLPPANPQTPHCPPPRLDKRSTPVSAANPAEHTLPNIDRNYGRISSRMQVSLYNTTFPAFQDFMTIKIMKRMMVAHLMSPKKTSEGKRAQGAGSIRQRR
jgi:hypothetical protein